METQISAQKESHESSLAQLKNDYTSGLENQEIKVQQEELEALHKSELQAKEAQHEQEIARLEKEKSAFHEENKKLLAGQKKLLSEQDSAYEGSVVIGI